MLASDTGELRISFPHLGDYHVIFRELLAMSGCKVISPPPITKHTLELGSRYSPDSVCIPFKYNLGNYLEAVQLGANAFCTTVGGCRFEYYFEVHKQVLQDLGYSVRFLRVSQNGLYHDLKAVNPNLSRLAFISHFWLVIKKLHLLDELADIKRKRQGFATSNNSFSAFWQRFLKRLPTIQTHGELRRFSRGAKAELLAIPIAKPLKPLRVGFIGELYTVMEPFSNFQMEDKLAGMGVEVHRWVTVSSILHHGVNGARAAPQLLSMARPYARYHVGAHGTESIGRLHSMIKEGFDGAIHLKPFACMPEINALPALHKMSRDYQFPLVTFSFDSHTAESGVMTRLEAFFDMITYRRQGGVHCASVT
ncbi:MAG: hypothetical protein A2Y63_07000 [Candidatus Riflebacteria bacterium RBG_13_59_9]|nr:MAG: hypothetical protein A2Y63_07000 [Candidatus Riflebacteria bacterium RBG_13_59_9]